MIAGWPALTAAAQDGTAPQGGSELERALLSHPYFSKIALERVEAPEPYLFLFQHVEGTPPQRATDLVQRLAPFLEGTRAVFEQHIVRPNGLERRAGHERFPVIVLASRVALVSCQAAMRTATHLRADAVHDPGLNACVLYDELTGDERPWLERVRAARHAFLHACQLAWYAVPGELPFQYWLFEGMADALACTAADPAQVRADPADLRRIVGDMQDPRRSFLNLRTLAELFSVGEPSRMDAFLRERLRGIPSPGTLDRSSFHRQASLLFAYLWSDESARMRPALAGFVGDALRGQAGAQEFHQRFATATEQELEQGFLNWILLEHARAYPLGKVDVERAQRAFVRGEANGFEPPAPTLELTDASPEERLALAIHRLASGAEEEAGRTLDALTGEALEPALKERVERERRRLAAWRALRAAHLGALAAQGGSLSFAAGGKSYQARVLALEGDEIALEKNRSGKERLPLGELDALALAQTMRPLGTPEDWARFVPYALREDPRTRKLLKDDGGEGGALLADARDDYPARLRLGRILARIEALGEAEEPDTREQAEKLLAELRALRTEGADLAVVQRKEPALLETARTWLEAVVELLEPHELFGGKLELLAGDRVRLTYAFDDPRELEDFEAGAYPAVLTEGRPALEVADQPFRLERGELVALGTSSLRSRIELGPPLSVRYRLKYEDSAPTQKTLRFYLGVADDRAQHFIAGMNFRTLLVYDAKSTDQAVGQEFPIELGSTYEPELLHDGEKVFLRCQGREVSIAAGGRKNGAFFLFAHTVYPLHVDHVVVEGSLLATSLAPVRKARVERELATF